MHAGSRVRPFACTGPKLSRTISITAESGRRRTYSHAFREDLWFQLYRRPISIFGFCHAYGYLRARHRLNDLFRVTPKKSREQRKKERHSPVPYAYKSWAFDTHLRSNPIATHVARRRKKNKKECEWEICQWQILSAHLFFFVSPQFFPFSGYILANMRASWMSENT